MWAEGVGGPGEPGSQRVETPWAVCGGGGHGTPTAGRQGAWGPRIHPRGVGESPSPGSPRGGGAWRQPGPDLPWGGSAHCPSNHPCPSLASPQTAGHRARPGESRGRTLGPQTPPSCAAWAWRGGGWGGQRHLGVGLAVGHVSGRTPLWAPRSCLLEHLLGSLGHPGRALLDAAFMSQPVWGTEARVAVRPGEWRPLPFRPHLLARATLTGLLLGPAGTTGGRSGQGPPPGLEMGAPCAGT